MSPLHHESVVASPAKVGIEERELVELHDTPFRRGDTVVE